MQWLPSACIDRLTSIRQGSDLWLCQRLQAAKAQESAFVPEVEEDDDMPAAAPDQAQVPSMPDQAAGRVQPDTGPPAPAPLPATSVAAGGGPAGGTETAPEPPQPAAEASTLHRLAAESASAGSFGLQVFMPPIWLWPHL